MTLLILLCLKSKSHNVEIHSISYGSLNLLNALFSQDEVPESLQLIHEWTADFSHDHKLIELATPLQVLIPKQYKAASEFCKMSGLLCSYGLYQVRKEMY